MKKIRLIPTILGLLFVIFSVALGIIAVRQGSTWFLRAEPETIPQQIKITNITDSSFSVSWITDGLTTGYLKYGETKINLLAEDDRDQISDAPEKYLTHHVTVRDLQPATAYIFKIGSEKKLFDNNGQAYETMTAPALITSPPASDVAYANVFQKNNQPAKGAIVYLSVDGMVPQSTLSKDSGSWIIALNLALASDLKGYAQYDKEKAVEEIFVQAGNQGTATAMAITANDNPLPQITLGQSYDFREGQSATGSPIAPPAASKFTFEELGPATEATEVLNITNPDEGEGIATAQPAISGTAPPNTILTVTLESSVLYTDTIRVDENGEWQWQPPEDLEPGNHKLTLSYTDSEGVIQKITRNFIVLADDSQLPAIEATPSATITPRPSPTVIPSPTPKPSITVAPSPTSTPLPGVTAAPATGEAVPEAGYPLPFFMLVFSGLGLLILSLGTFSFKKTK